MEKEREESELWTVTCSAPRARSTGEDDARAGDLPQGPGKCSCASGRGNGHGAALFPCARAHGRRTVADRSGARGRATHPLPEWNPIHDECVQHHLPLGPHILKKFQKSSPNLISTFKIDQGSDFSEFVFFWQYPSGCPSAEQRSSCTTPLRGSRCSEIPKQNMTCLTPFKCGSLEVPELPQPQALKPKPIP